ncbi:hypothetical protein SH139x_001422 [Planctomycetaceae bacterium SH139]
MYDRLRYARVNAGDDVAAFVRQEWFVFLLASISATDTSYLDPEA